MGDLSDAREANILEWPLVLNATSETSEDAPLCMIRLIDRTLQVCERAFRGINTEKHFRSLLHDHGDVVNHSLIIWLNIEGLRTVRVN